MERLLLGGKSMGGRMATHLAAAGFNVSDGGPPLGGIVALGYPLHPPGKPEQLRDAHLPKIRVPVLIVQGSRDTFGTPAELTPVVARMTAPVTVHVVEGGDHSFTVGRTPRETVLDRVADVVAGWASRYRTGARLTLARMISSIVYLVLWIQTLSYRVAPIRGSG